MSIISQEMKAVHSSLTSGPARKVRIANFASERKKIADAVDFGLVQQDALIKFDQQYCA